MAFLVRLQKNSAPACLGLVLVLSLSGCTTTRWAMQTRTNSFSLSAAGARDEGVLATGRGAPGTTAQR
jgi:hypothetical protein